MTQTQTISQLTDKQIIEALLCLSGRCDGAGAKDGQGFNKIDARFGHSLANSAQYGRLTHKQLSAARKILVKYNKQLQSANIV